MLNRIDIEGRLTKTPELSTAQSGTTYTRFSLAVERDYQEKDGTRPVDFIDCVAWRNTAEFVCKYFTKGQMAIATGRLQVRGYKDNNGSNRRISEVNVDSVYFAGKKETGSSGQDAGQTARWNSGSEYAAQELQGFTDIPDDEEDYGPPF